MLRLENSAKIVDGDQHRNGQRRGGGAVVALPRLGDPERRRGQGVVQLLSDSDHQLLAPSDRTCERTIWWGWM